MDKIGIYIHFPFCYSKCNYCAFNSFAGVNDLQLKYFESLIKEINLYRNKKIKVDTIFIGGGTPSIMFDGCIATLLNEIRKIFDVLEDAEITIEANPNSVTKSKVQEWKESGVNRVSVGLQTTNENILKQLGRPHTKNDFIMAINDIKSVGITNINVDCLIGLPSQKLVDVRHTLKLVNKLGASHVSVYCLILEENTPLYNMVNSGKVTLPKEEKVLGMYDFAVKFLNECGFKHYEVSNFAKEGFVCLHNLHTWQMHEYLGFGAGAHGYKDLVRYSNVSSIDEYINLISSTKKPIFSSETLKKSDLFEETIMLGLRTIYGINLNKISKDFGIDLKETKKDIIAFFQSNDYIKIENDNLSLTEKGLPILNKIILELVS